MTRLRTQADADSFFGLTTNEIGQRTWEEEESMEALIEFSYDGHRVLVPVEFSIEESSRLNEIVAGAISVLGPQGFAVPASNNGTAISAPVMQSQPFAQRIGAPPPVAQQQYAQPVQRAAGCPHHGAAKAKLYNGHWECTVSTTERPAYPFDDPRKQGFTFMGKDGKPWFVCAEKWQP